MRPCKTCGHMIANNARACPNCGQTYSRVSGCLAFTIIFFVISIMIGYFINNLSKSDIGTSSTDEGLFEQIEKPSQEFVEDALKKMTIKHDDIKEMAWYYDKSTPESNNTNNIHLYIGQEKAAKTFLRFVIRYSSSNWLFIENYNIKVDNSVFVIPTSFGEVKRDNAYDSIWEWYDTKVDRKILTIVSSIIAAKNVKIRCNGQKYYDERTITKKEKKSSSKCLRRLYCSRRQINQNIFYV